MKFRRVALGASAVLLLTSGVVGFAHQRQMPPAAVDIREIMSASEFKAAGLDKLSADEMKALNSWFTKFTLRVVSTATPNTVSPLSSARAMTGCATAIETQIDGTFNGWNGDTIFKLTNGQIWQQSSYAYTYHYAYRPDVTIYQATGGCRMKVDGIDDVISVKQIK